MKKNILIIEDEPGIVDAISYALKTDGFETFWASTGKEGLKILSSAEIDLIILDIGLPDISGFELLKNIREKSSVPVLFLTARSEEIDKVLGLELGADDYIVKPFSPRELTARIKAVLRRIDQPRKKHDGHLPFYIDLKKRQIEYYKVKLDLTRYEYEILSLMIKRPGWVFSREHIMDLVWVEPEESFDRTVDTHIKTIRAKLKDIKPKMDPIVTHRGVGYSLKENL
ncbi:two-component system response regulator CreB [Spirochaetota bacterium]